MSHVTDGELHLVLDGALELVPDERAREVREHLDACGDCARRLEEERRVRERSREILGSDGHAGGSPPPFEELRNRALGGGPAGRTGAGASSGAGSPERRWTPGLRRLAWAASVVLALGVGWYAGSAVPGSGPAGGASPGPELAESDAPATGEASRPGEARQEDATAGALASGREAGVPAETAATTGRAADTGDPEGSVPARAIAGSMAVPGLPVVAVSWESSDGARYPGLRVTQRLPGGDTLVLRYDPAGPEAVATAQADTPSDVAPAARAEAPSAGAPAAAERRAAGAEETEATLEGRSRAPERTDEGARRPEAMADGAPEPARGEDVVVRLRRASWIVEARGPVSADSLRTLLERLPPPE